MVNGEHVHIAPPRSIASELVSAQVVEIILLLCGAEKFRCSKGKFILAVFAAIRIIASLYIGGLLVQSLRIMLCPVIGSARSLEHAVSKSLVERSIHARSLSHHCCKVKRCGQALFNGVTLGAINFRHRAGAELERRELVVNTTVLVLHRKHPVQIPADFFEECRHLREFTRDVPLERIHECREVFIKFQKRKHGNARVHNVLAVVTGIVPTALRLDNLRVSLLGSRLALGLCHNCRRRQIRTVNRHAIVNVASGTSPLTCITRIESHACTLVVEPLEGSLRQIFIDVLANHDRVADIAVSIQTVRARLLNRRNIVRLDFFAAIIPVIDHRSFERKHRVARHVADFERVRVVTGDDDRLFGFGGKAKLVHQGDSHCRHSKR